MKNEEKIIIVFGMPENEKVSLVNKLMKEKYLIKSIDGNVYNHLFHYLNAEIGYNMKDTGKDTLIRSRLLDLMNGCYAVILFEYAESDRDGSNLDKYEYLRSVVDISKECGVKWFFYISGLTAFKGSNTITDSIKKKISYSKNKCTEFNRSEEYLDENASNDFNTCTIKPDSKDNRIKDIHLKLLLTLFVNGNRYKRKFDIFRPTKQYKYGMRYKSHHEVWNTSTFIESINTVCMELLKNNSRVIIRNYWNFKTNFKVFFLSGNRLKYIYEHIFHPIRTYRSYGVILMRQKDLYVMLLLFLIWPEQVYRFSTRKMLPPKGERHPKRDKIKIPPVEIIASKTDDIPKMDTISIVMKGSNYLIKDIIKNKSSVFMAGFSNRLETYQNEKFIKKHNVNVTYVYPANVLSRNLVESGLSMIIIDNKRMGDNKKIYSYCDEDTLDWLHKRCKVITVLQNEFPQPLVSVNYIPSGSGLLTIATLYHFAKKIDVYGWDFYLNRSPSDMNYLELLMNTFNYQYDKRSQNHFESMMINLYYGYHISKLPNVTVHGYLGQLDRHKKMIDRIERVLFD